MRRLALAPLAVLGTACASRPWTPAVSVDHWAQDPPNGEMTALPTARTLIEEWQLPRESPWSPYVKLTLLSAPNGGPAAVELPEVRSLEVVQRAEIAADRLARVGVPRDAMLVLDLRGAASVAFASALVRMSKQPVAPVVTFNNWPNDRGLVPAEETLAALIALPPRRTLSGDAEAVPVLLLDAWRLAFRFDAPPDDVVDNRYALTPSDLPDAETLRAHGIARVIYVVESLDEASTEEDDVHEAALGWQRAGIKMSIVDLSWIEGLPIEPLTPMALDHEQIEIEPRVTLLRDPTFYARARGGFGGVYTGATSPHVRAGASLGGGIGGSSWGHGGG